MARDNRVVVELINETNEHWGTYATTADGRKYAIAGDEYARILRDFDEGIKLEYSAIIFEAQDDGSPKRIYNGFDETGKSKDDVSLKVNVDVSEALTGLKAVQREARKATQALRELERAQKDLKG